MPRRHLIVAALGLFGLVAWEWRGWDLAVSGFYGNAGGFAWRDLVLTRDVLHTGGRTLAGLLLALLALDATRPIIAGPPRRARWAGLLLCLSALVVVPALKRVSATSCPWDLAAFGGSFPYVPHWWVGISDGGPGHCFPSGHAVAAFAFYGVGFAWERHRPRLAHAWWVGVTLLGALFGWAQLARGAHFVSHTLWSAWLCWAIGAVGVAVLLRGQASVLSHDFGHRARLRARRRARQPAVGRPECSNAGNWADNRASQPTRRLGWNAEQR